MFFTTKQLDKQKKILNVKFKNCDYCSLNFIQKLLNQIIKACQTIIIDATILTVEN